MGAVGCEGDSVVYFAAVGRGVCVRGGQPRHDRCPVQTIVPSLTMMAGSLVLVHGSKGAEAGWGVMSGAQRDTAVVRNVARVAELGWRGCCSASAVVQTSTTDGCAVASLCCSWEYSAVWPDEGLAGAAEWVHISPPKPLRPMYVPP